MSIETSTRWESQLKREIDREREREVEREKEQVGNATASDMDKF